MKSTVSANVLKSTSHLFRVAFFCVTLIMTAAIVQAQNTNNPQSQVTTNTTALWPIGTNGYGVALLGYPRRSPLATNFFGNLWSGEAISYSSVATDQVGMTQFYAATYDSSSSGGNVNNVFGFRVLQSNANPSQLTVIRNLAAICLPTTNCTTPDVGEASMGGVSTDGTIVVMLGATGAPCSPSVNSSTLGLLEVSANTPIAIMYTNYTGCLAQETLESGDLPTIGQHGDLVAKNSFANCCYVARPDIAVANLTPPSNLTAITGNVQIISNPWVENDGSFNTRGSLTINDTAKIMATYLKDAVDHTNIGDVETSVGVFQYTDAGGPITITGFYTNTFGNISGTLISTNADYFFSVQAFLGPPQVAINDLGALAITCGIGVTNAQGVQSGGSFTRNPCRSAIIYAPPGTTNNWQFVCDNQDPTLFYIPPSCGCLYTDGTTVVANSFSQPTLDNYGNVYFTAMYTNFSQTIACNSSGGMALYEAVANAVPPTSWSVRILLKEDDVFTNQVSVTSNEAYQVYSMYGVSQPSHFAQAGGMRPDSLNRTQLAGHDSSNTQPSSPFTIGGLLVGCTVTNRTSHYRTDALLLVGPYATNAAVVSSGPFIINSITRSGSDINLIWSGLSGANVVQASSGDARGSYSNNYLDLATVTLPSAMVTNYTDIGGGTNSPSRYYRVKAQQ